MNVSAPSGQMSVVVVLVLLLLLLVVVVVGSTARSALPVDVSTLW